MHKINIAEKFTLFQDHWSPKIAAELNGQQVRLAKLKGEFIWHKHDNEDELFMVIRGQLDIEFRDQTISLSEGEMLVVPRGVEHKPVAHDEAWVMLFEPAETVNTGAIQNERTKHDLKGI